MTNFRRLSTRPDAVVFESAHPYSDSYSNTFEVNVPNAQAVEIAFSEESSTEARYDYIQFLKSSDGTASYGSERYSGGRNGSAKQFPGVGSTKTLVIPTSKFWVKFESDG